MSFQIWFRHGSSIMENLIGRMLIVFGLVISILAMPRPDGFDDEGEMSVPRSPKIQGPTPVNLPFTSPEEINNLQCLIEGSPTPTVIWLKDGQEIQGDAGLYNVTFNVTGGRADLYFTESAKQDSKYVAGNFTCIAANFLGRVQKIFILESAETNTSTSTATSTNTTISTTEDSVTTSSGNNSVSSYIGSTSSSSPTAFKNSTASSIIKSSTSSAAPEVTHFGTSKTSSKPTIIVTNGTTPKIEP